MKTSTAPNKTHRRVPEPLALTLTAIHAAGFSTAAITQNWQALGWVIFSATSAFFFVDTINARSSR